MSVLKTSSLNQTMPHRDTVARVAYFKSWTSNMMRTYGKKPKGWFLKTFKPDFFMVSVQNTLLQLPSPPFEFKVSKKQRIRQRISWHGKLKATAANSVGELCFKILGSHVACKVLQTVRARRTVDILNADSPWTQNLNIHKEQIYMLDSA